MPPELLPLCTHGGPFAALLGLLAWLVPKALAVHREMGERFASELAASRKETRAGRRVMRRVADRLEVLTTKVDGLEQTVRDCPHHAKDQTP